MKYIVPLLITAMIFIPLVVSQTGSEWGDTPVGMYMGILTALNVAGAMVGWVLWWEYNE